MVTANLRCLSIVVSLLALVGCMSAADLPEPEEQPKVEATKPPPFAVAPFDAEQAKAHQNAWAEYLGVEVETTNSIGMKFRVIPPGEFLMGSSEEEIDKLLEEAKGKSSVYQMRCIRHEGPQHKVVLTKPFGTSIHEVTRGQFRQFVAATGYKTEAEKDGKGGWGWRDDGGWRDGKWLHAPEFLWNTQLGFDTEQTDDHPVVNVSCNDAVAFCEWLSNKEAVTYRLPTEAEWEFACRAGSLARFSFGNEESLLKEYAWYANEGGKNTHPVGQKRANALGLFDLHGNVWEWCHDRHRSYTTARAVDPVGPSQSLRRVMRGGGFTNSSLCVHSAYRYQHGLVFSVYYRDNELGFRPVRTYDLPARAGKTR